MAAEPPSWNESETVVEDRPAAHAHRDLTAAPSSSDRRDHPLRDVTGQRQEAAQRTLNSAGFKSGVVYAPSDESQGRVVCRPRAG